MKGKHTLLGLALLLAGAVGCDPSKPELEKTKAELTTVTAERDSLKTQLEQANGKVTALTQQVTDLQAKAAAAAAPAPAAEEKEDPKAKKGAKKPAAKADVAPPPTAEQKKEMEKAPEARKGRGHL